MSGFNYVIDNNTFLSTPGAWLYDGGTSNRWPIFKSGNLTELFNYTGTAPNINMIDDAWAVLPGFKLQLYVNTNYGGSPYTLDNTSGTKFLTQHIDNIGGDTNSIQSVKLYHNGNLLS
jgi:hypothetical protein